jgi:phosphatidylglycerol:prolipoprotein diacylglycerol transferase
MAPVLFTLGWIDVPSFTALMVLALGAGLLLTWNMTRRANLPQADVFDAALVGVLVGILAARAMYVFENWNYFHDHTDQIAQLWMGGLAWHGGLIGGAIGTAAFSAGRKLNVRAVFDELTPGLMAGAALGWIGAFLAGVAYGREVFPGDVGWFLAADLPDIYGLRNPRFATQLIGAAWAAMCFAVVIGAGKIPKSEIRSQRPEVRVSTFAVTIALYSTGTFVLGFARGDAVPMLGAWRLDQLIDAAIIIAGATCIIRTAPRSLLCRRKNNQRS